MHRRNGISDTPIIAWASTNADFPLIKEFTAPTCGMRRKVGRVMARLPVPPTTMVAPLLILDSPTYRLLYSAAVVSYTKSHKKKPGVYIILFRSIFWTQRHNSAIFAEEGPNTHFPRFQYRSDQYSLVQQVLEQLLKNQGQLVVEAGTGTGKVLPI